MLRNKPDFRRKPWQNISASAKDFVKKILVKDPRARLTAAQALCMFIFLNLVYLCLETIYLGHENNFSTPKTVQLDYCFRYICYLLSYLKGRNKTANNKYNENMKELLLSET